MNDALHATLAGWTNFYLLTGTAAATLTGLQFVVQTLLLASRGQQPVVGDDPESGIAAFGTPTVVHFTLTLLVSAALCAPWPTDGPLRATLGALAVGALGYSGVVMRRTRRQPTYTPVAEDWLWHVVLPGAAYSAVLVAALRLGNSSAAPLALLAGATLVLLCVGIHNSWDLVTFLTIASIRSTRRGGDDAPGAPPPRPPAISAPRPPATVPRGRSAQPSRGKRGR